jgi:hypothetical protein
MVPSPPRPLVGILRVHGLCRNMSACGACVEAAGPPAENCLVAPWLRICRLLRRLRGGVIGGMSFPPRAYAPWLRICRLLRRLRGGVIGGDDIPHSHGRSLWRRDTTPKIPRSETTGLHGLQPEHSCMNRNGSRASPSLTEIVRSSICLQQTGALRSVIWHVSLSGG